LVWLKFIACLAIIIFAGSKLARYGDAISEKTGLGRIWIGLVLLAAITTMPELVTSISAVALVEVEGPDLSLGTLLGSCIFNLSILALLDVLHRRTPILSQASPRHVLTASVGILLIAIAAGGILAGERLAEPAIGWVGVPGIIIAILYLIAMRQMFRLERSRPVPPPQADQNQYAGISTRTVYLRFIAAAIPIIAAGIWLSLVGDEIAETTGWGASFVGSMFLAVSTSLPELVVTITALRLGAIDLAVADILGANILDIAIIIWADLSYTGGPMLSAVSGAHLITAVIAIAMSAIVIAGLRLKQERKTFIISSWYAPVLIGLYIYGAYALFHSGLG